MRLDAIKKRVNSKIKEMSIEQAISFKEGYLYALEILENNEYLRSLANILKNNERIKSLEKILENSKHIDHLEDVLEATSEVVNISVDKLKSPSQARTVTEARFLYFYISRELYPKVAYEFIGDLVNKSHANVIYGVKTINDLNDVDHKIKNLLEEIKDRL